MRDYSASPNACAAQEFELVFKNQYQIPRAIAGSLRQLSTSLPALAASSVTETPIPRTSLPWSAAPRCVSPRRRAVNRALRKAYGIGLCSVEELGSRSSFVEPTNGNAPHCRLPGMVPESARPAFAIGSAS